MVHRPAGPIGEATEGAEAGPPLMGNMVRSMRRRSSSGSSSGSEADQEQVTAEMFEATRQLRGGQQSQHHHHHVISGHGVGADLDMEGVRLDFDAKDFTGRWDVKNLRFIDVYPPPPLAMLC